MADIERRSLSHTLLGIAVTVREPRDSEAEATRYGYLVIARKDNGQMVAMIDRDDLFDRDGNRFIND